MGKVCYSRLNYNASYMDPSLHYNLLILRISTFPPPLFFFLKKDYIILGVLRQGLS
jgi:hypothetical protein